MDYKLYHISYKKEILDSLELVNIIKKDEWINSSTIIVNCSPDYSSIPTQILNHGLSHLNGNELFEQLSVEMPYPTMSQIWNRETLEFQHYDRYLQEWANKYLSRQYNYLFIDSATLRGKNFAYLKNVARTKIDNYKFASLYLEKSSIFTPDYYVEQYDKDIRGNVIFEWENANNPNWNY